MEGDEALFIVRAGDGEIVAVGRAFDHPQRDVPAGSLGAFEHLARAGLIKGDFTGTAGGLGTTHGILGTNLPESAVADVGFYFDHADNLNGYVSSDSVLFDGQYGHYLTVGWQDPASNVLPVGAFLTPREALQVDEKFDDARPAYGSIRAFKSARHSNCLTSDTAASAAYAVGYGSEACGLAFIVGM